MVRSRTRFLPRRIRQENCLVQTRLTNIDRARKNNAFSLSNTSNAHRGPPLPAGVSFNANRICNLLTGNRACIDRSSDPVAISYPDKARMETSGGEGHGGCARGRRRRTEERGRRRVRSGPPPKKKGRRPFERHRRSSCKLRLNIPWPG